MPVDGDRIKRARSIYRLGVTVAAVEFMERKV